MNARPKEQVSAANRLNPGNNPIVLVLQGGGALGAYQAGVFEALHENALVPDWVVGTSIGAINAALIAGNPPESRLQRLKEFWHRVSHGDGMDMSKIPDEARKANVSVATLDTVMRGVPGFFAPRWFNPFAAGLAVEPDAASFYETHDLVKTLRELVDFDYLNAEGGMRMTVNALKVTCGELASFDNRRQDLRADHIMASGALPPGFPPVRIDGELYWDGGLYSNTPLETVLNDMPHTNTLCFMVDLWNAHGEEPRTLDEVQTRQKEVMFASRSMRHIDAYLETHKLQRALRDLYKRLPAGQKTASDKRLLSELKCDTTLHIVRIPYAGQDWHMAAKDINFSRGSIEWRWQQGYQDGGRAIRQAGWLVNTSQDVAVVMHELAPEPHQSP